MPFCTGYGVDLGLLLDVYALAGIEALAQVDLDVRQNRHRPLDELTPMASAVLAALTSRLRCSGRLTDDPHACRVEPPERPPLAELGVLGAGG